jgi:DNA invertase Pin-like site-specific DNA recombinase
MKVAAYLKRYAGLEGPGMSPAEQRERIERHIADRGWELAAVLDDSGPEVGPREFPRLERLLAKPGDVRKLVVANVDRIGRLPRPILSVMCDVIDTVGIMSRHYADLMFRRVETRRP